MDFAQDRRIRVIIIHANSSTASTDHPVVGNGNNDFGGNRCGHRPDHS